VGVTEETQEVAPWVKVMSACPLMTITAVRGAPVEFASVEKKTNAPDGPMEPEAFNHVAVLDVFSMDGLDGHEPVAVIGNWPKVADGPVRIVSYGADRVQPACANASTGGVSIRRAAPHTKARKLREIIGCAPRDESSLPGHSLFVVSDSLTTIEDRDFGPVSPSDH